MTAALVLASAATNFAALQTVQSPDLALLLLNLHRHLLAIGMVTFAVHILRSAHSGVGRLCGEHA